MYTISRLICPECENGLGFTIDLGRLKIVAMRGATVIFFEPLGLPSDTGRTKGFYLPMIIMG